MQNMQNFNFNVKKISIFAGIGILAIILIIFGIKSYPKIEPGHRGVIFYQWGNGLDVKTVYNEGRLFVAPWNELITYDVQQKNVDLTMNVLDKNGLEVGIDITVLYNPIPSHIGRLHNGFGRDFVNVIVIPRARSAGREVAGEFSADELYSAKRDMLQTGIEKLLLKKYGESFVELVDVLIRDVNLPIPIKKAIEAKQEQDQKNELASKLEAEATSRANAAVAQAEGNKQSAILEAQGEAISIKLKQEQLAKSPQYIEFLKVQGYAEHGKSWYGENNVFGDGAATVIKGLK